MRFLNWMLFILISAGLNIVWCTCSPANSRILTVHSAHPENEWVRQIEASLAPHIKTGDITYRTFYLDTVRKSDPAWKLAAAQQARQLIERFVPHVVIAFDDNAQAYVTRNFIDNSEIQFVFAGVNADPDFYGFPAANVTGILERTYPEQALALLKRIVDASLNVVWVSDDSATANLVLRRVRQKAENGRLPLSISRFIQPGTFDQWKRTIRSLQEDRSVGALLIPLYHTVKTEVDGPSLSASEVMQWTAAQIRKPIVGLWPDSTDDGALCAVVVDPAEHGKVAGLMARKILSGRKAKELPMTVNEHGYVIVNNAAADRLGIDMPFEVLRLADKIIE